MWIKTIDFLVKYDNIQARIDSRRGDWLNAREGETMSKAIGITLFVLAILVILPDPYHPRELATEPAWWALPLQMGALLYVIAFVFFLAQRERK
jgi:hypothetical protein